MLIIEGRNRVGKAGGSKGVTVLDKGVAAGINGGKGRKGNIR